MSLALVQTRRTLALLFALLFAFAVALGVAQAFHSPAPAGPAVVQLDHFKKTTYYHD